MLTCLLCAASPALAQTSPSPSPTPVPNITWQVNASGYSFKTNNPNATGALDTTTGADTGSRTDYSNIQASVTRNTGLFRFGTIIGEYAFPVVGQAINPTFKAGANTDLFSFVPVAYMQYVPNGAWTFTAGKMAALLGQESNFTYQNVNIQRGLGWNAEPAFTRGVRGAYTQGKFTGTLGYTDGYYSGRLNSLEGLLAWVASSNTTVQFAWIAPPNNSGPNPTAGIANKREADLMLTQQFGKLQLLPYLLWIDSPQNTSIGYNGDERAFAGVLIASYVFDNAWSVGARYESIVNRSSTLDLGANADLVGFGPGSKATTLTLTPAFKTGHTTIRAEYSNVNLGAFTPGLGFGNFGTTPSQSRVGLELGVQF
ncbi:MAG: outer membrane beta-barrel protein [Candidatus Eremiobacteraeota bacterium]|nr:outer membrane beta-barrel protein [Candidatus Eremiobacteraeota bacterium]